MLDQSAPIHLQPPRDTKVAGVLNATTQQLPNIRVRCKALVSNTSFTAISIKSYQVACQTQNGMWAIQLGKSLYTSDDVPIKAGTNIDAGKSLSLFIQGTCEISLNAFNLLRTEPMCSLSEADGILASHDTNLFGQAPQIQRMPDGLQVKAFTAKGYPSLSVRITTTRDRNFSWDIPWNGNDLF
jgi:hypothetical protein